MSFNQKINKKIKIARSPHPPANNRGPKTREFFSGLNKNIENVKHPILQVSCFKTFW
jgi:hypothetical protein